MGKLDQRLLDGYTGSYCDGGLMKDAADAGRREIGLAEFLNTALPEPVKQIIVAAGAGAKAGLAALGEETASGAPVRREGTA